MHFLFSKWILKKHEFIFTLLPLYFKEQFYNLSLYVLNGRLKFHAGYARVVQSERSMTRFGCCIMPNVHALHRQEGKFLNFPLKYCDFYQRFQFYTFYCRISFPVHSSCTNSVKNCSKFLLVAWTWSSKNANCCQFCTMETKCQFLLHATVKDICISQVLYTLT